MSSVQKITSTIDADQFDWQFSDDGSILLNGKIVDAEVKIISPNSLSILLNGQSYFATIDKRGSAYNVSLNGQSFEVLTESSGKKAANLMLGKSNRTQPGTEVRSPMPGMVVRCEVKEGDSVKTDTGLVILEAMKMENEIRATREGVVKKLLVRDKQVVEKGELLLIIE